MQADKQVVPAYLSIFVSLTLTLVLSLCLVLIEAARQNTVKLEAECIADVGVESVLAEYHREVFGQYNLFFVDCSYGSDFPSYYNTEARLRDYVGKNISIKEELGILSNIYMDPLALEASKVKITGVSLATDNRGYSFQKQALQAVKNDVGIDFIEKILSWINVVEEKGLRENRMEEQIYQLEKELEMLREKKKKEDSWVEVEIHNPAEEILQIRRKGLLNWVVKSEQEISSKVIRGEQYISERRADGVVNEGNFVSEQSLTLYEQMFFREYLMRYAGNYLKKKENSELDYQAEYLLFGKESDTENLRKTAAAVCGLRETANLLYLTGSSEKRGVVKTVSTVLSAGILMPEAARVFEGLLLTGWAYLESLQDTKILLSGGQVPLVKDDTSWNCSLDNLFDLNIKEEKEQQGLGYEDYLRILMYFTDLEKVTFRFMDLMEMDIRRTEGNEYFRLDGCLDYIETEVRIRSGFGFEFEVRHADGYR